jgi:hypothetical protein
LEPSIGQVSGFNKFKLHVRLISFHLPGSKFCRLCDSIRFPAIEGNNVKHEIYKIYIFYYKYIMFSNY